MMLKSFFSSKGSQGKPGLGQSLLRERLRHTLWAMGLFSLLFFFALTIPTIMGLQQYFETIKFHPTTPPESVPFWLYASNPLAIALVGVFALLMATLLFRFLHSKKQVDFYHGLPAGRRQLFWASYGTGLLALVPTYLLNLLLSTLIVALSGLGDSLDFSKLATALLWNSVFYLAVFSICMLGHLLAGTLATGLLCGSVLLVTPPLALLVYQYTMSVLYSNWNLPVLVMLRRQTLLSPVLQRVVPLDLGKSPLGGIFFWLAISLLLLALCRWLYQKRPSECAGRAVAFWRPALVLKYWVVLLCTLLGGFLFAALAVPRFWLWFGFFCGGLFAHCLIGVIYHLDFKAALRHIKGFAVYMVLFSCGFVAMQADVFGINNFVPRPDQVRSVGIGGELLRLSQSDYLDMELTDPESIQTAVDLGNLYFQFQQDNSWHKSADSRVTTLSLRYTLKSGREVYRIYYSMPRADVLPLILDLSASPEFKALCAPPGIQAGNFAHRVTVSQRYYDRGFSIESPPLIEELTQTLWQEQQAQTGEDLLRQAPVLRLQFQHLGAELYDSLDPEYQVQYATDLPVYPGYTRTLALLERAGYAPQTLTATQVPSVSLCQNPYSLPAPNPAATPVAGLPQPHEPPLVITDQAAIARLLQAGVPEYLMQYNPFLETDGIEMTLTIDGQGNAPKYLFPKGQFPTEVLKTQ